MSRYTDKAEEYSSECVDTIADAIENAIEAFAEEAMLHIEMRMDLSELQDGGDVNALATQEALELIQQVLDNWRSN